MSSQSPFGGRRGARFPTLPKGSVVETYETYQEAQAAVDTLAKADFPVKELSIIGSDLKTVERVTGKLTWGRVAIAGAASGAWLGVFFGLLFFIFSPAGAGLPFLIAAVLIGAGFGMLFGVVSYSINRRRRDFTSTMQVIASGYQIIAEGSHVNRARNLLTGQGDTANDERVTDAGAAPHPSDPPRPLPPQAAPPAPHEDPTPSDVPAGTPPPAEPPRYGERPNPATGTGDSAAPATSVG